jgi:hypothetical protein
VEPLTDTDRRTIVRWIDLGCPIDLDSNAENPQKETYGWMCDDNRPTVALTYPKAGVNDSLSRILIGLDDYYSGLDLNSLEVKADFAIDGSASGENIAARFKQVSPGVWELRLAKAITELARGELTVAVRDRQGNRTYLKRTFAVVKPRQ